MTPRLTTSLAIALCLTPLTAASQSADTEQTDNSANTTVVNVRGRQTLQQRFMAPNSMVVIDRQDIENMGANSIGDILRQTPGLQVTVTPNGGLEIRMRGMSMENTRILIDGSPVSTSGRTSQLPLDELPSDLIQRVEVLRSPTAEFQGTAGGTINIVMRSATPRPETYIWVTDQIVWGKNAPRIFLSQTGPLSAPTKSGDTQTAPVWSYFVSLTGGERLTGSDTDRQTSSSGIVTSNGSSHEKWRAQGTDWTLTPRLNGRLSDTDQITLRAVLSTTNRSGLGSSSGTGSNTSAATSNFSTEQPYIYKRDFSQLAVDWAHRFKSNRLETTLSIERGAEIYQFNRTTVTAVSGNNSATYADDRNDTGILLRSKLQGIAGENIWSIGTELESRKQNVLNVSSSNNTAAAPLSLQATVQRNALYAQNEWSLPKNTTLTTGLRAQQTKVESTVIGGTSMADDRIFLQPSINSRTSIDENNQFRMNLARVSRSPRVWELIGRTVTESLNNSPSNPDFRGNPTLKSETTVTFDVGWDRKLSNGGQTGINLFARKLQDAIARKTFQDTKGQWIQQPTNIGDATVWGIEADVRSNLVWAGFDKDWTLGANASLLNSKLDGGDAPGSRIPGQARYLANVNIAKPLRVAGGWYGGASVNLVGASDYDYSYQKTNGSAGSEKAHTNIDFYFGQVLPNLGFWRLNLYNITDFKRNRNRVTTDSAGTTTYIDNSIVRLTPRIFLTLGTRF
jgi:outer membrane receptor for ferrienterochelin and colicins